MNKVILVLAASWCLLWGLVGCASTEPQRALAREYFNLGNAYLELKRYADASRAFGNAVDLQSDFYQARFNWARALSEQGQTDQALEQLNKVLEVDPGNLTVKKLTAWALYSAKRFSESATLWKALQKELPGDADTQFNAGLALLAVDDKAGAVVALERWKELESKPSTQNVQRLASLYSELGNWEKAKSNYKLAISLGAEGSHHVNALWVTLADAQAGQKEYDDALESYKQAATLYKNSPEAGPVWIKAARLALIPMSNFDAGWSLLQKAWESGYRKPEDWTSLRQDTSIPDRDRLGQELDRVDWDKPPATTTTLSPAVTSTTIPGGTTTTVRSAP